MKKTYSYTKKLVLLLITLFTAQFAIAATITTNPPATASVCAGGTISITAAATNTLVWQISTNGGVTWSNIANGGTNPTYSGATTGTLTMTNVPITYNNYRFRLRASGGAGGTVTSTACILTVNALPVITTQPSAAIVCAGSNTSYTVAATGTTLTYQWKVSTTGVAGTYNNVTNTGVYTGAQTSTLNITGATAGMNTYYYECVVTGAGSCNVTTTPALLTVNALPAIGTQPSNSVICLGQNASFGVVATGTGLTYQWQVSTTGVGGTFNNVTVGAPYSGSTTATLTLTNPSAAFNGYAYKCIVTGTCPPAATSNAVTLTINSLPAITAQPTPQTICAGQNASFGITATGTNITYQWKVSTAGIGGPYSNVTNTGVYAGATTATLNITGAPATMNGYYYECVVSGACTPAVTCTPVLFTVNALPTIVSQSTSTSTCPGNNASFSVNATGTGLSYQWYENQGSGFNPLTNTGIYSGVTSNELDITGASAAMNGYIYKCVISGTCTPPVTTNNDTLFINSVLLFSIQPTNTITCVGSNTGFNIAVSGTGLAYQWQVNQGSGFNNISNNAIYSGVNTNSLSISNPTVAMNNYTYHCIVSSTCSAPTTSGDGTLTVNTLPTITTQPTSTSKCAGGTATYTIAATGTGITYQWYEDQGSGFNPLSDIGIYSGTSTNILTINGVLQSMNGYHYQCVVSGACNPVATSNSVQLTVIPNVVPNVSIIGANTVCNGSIQYDTAITNVVGASYQWHVNSVNMGTNSNLFSYVPVNGDQITCTVTAASGTCYIPNNGTSNTITMTVTNFPSPATPVITSNSPVCVPNPVYILATCTTPNVTFSWTGPSNYTATTPNITFNPSVPGENGTYSVTVTTTDGCTAMATANIVVNAAPVVSSYTTSDPTTCGATNGSITLYGLTPNATYTITYVKNGVPLGPFTFTANSLGKLVMTGLTEAVYSSITITPNGGGCASVSIGPIYLNNPNPPAPPVITSNSPLCTGNTLNLGISSPVSGGLYAWSGPAGFSATTVTASVNNFQTANQGVYSVFVTDPVTNCMSLTSTTIASINPTINSSVSISGDVSVCSGSASLYTATTNIPGASYQWRVNTASVGTNSATYSYVPANGDHIKCIVTAPVGTCFSPSPDTSNTLTISVNTVQAPIITVTGNTHSCSGVSQTYTAITNVVGGTYQWVKNGTIVSTSGNTYTVTPNNNDTILCVVTGGSCYSPSSATSSQLIISVDLTVVTNIAINGNLYVQGGSSNTYTATSNVTGGSYQWKVNTLNVGTNSSTYTYVPQDNDKITCTVTAPNGTCYSPSSLTSKIDTIHIWESISNVQDGTDIQVYPNPFNDHINIAGLKMGDKLAIYDMLGRKVTQTWIIDNEQKEQMFPINDLSAGTYILEILDSENLRKGSTPLLKQ